MDEDTVCLSVFARKVSLQAETGKRPEGPDQSMGPERSYFFVGLPFSSMLAVVRTGWFRLTAVACLALGAYVFYPGRALTHAPGVLAPDPPRQAPLADAPPIRHRGYRLTPVAGFTLEARVLGKKAYRGDPTARLAPYDLAVGWGPMSDSAILDRYTIRQQQRAYVWESRDAPLSTREVILHSTNMHLIPATDAVAGALVRVRPGHVVRLEGRLVDVLDNDGSRWRTSRTRRDAGIGACEIVWVEALEIVPR